MDKETTVGKWGGMMIAKLIGSMFIITASSIIGVMIARMKSERVRQIRNLISALNMLDVEVRFALSSLPEAFNKISKAIDPKTGEIFEHAAELIINGKHDACNAWQKSLEHCMPALCINREDMNILAALGNSLGEVDSESQSKNIRLVIEQLKRQELRADEERAKGERLFRSIGVLSGLAIVIILF